MSISKEGITMIRLVVLAFAVMMVASLVPREGLQARQQLGRLDQPSNNLYTRSAAVYIDRGTSARQRRPEAAMDFFQQAMEQAAQSIEAEPGNARGWFQMGWSATEYMLLAVRHKEAESTLSLAEKLDSTFARSVELFPEYRPHANRQRQQAWAAVFNTGTDAIRAGDFDRAIDRMESAIAIDGSRPQPHLSLANIYTQQADWDGAMEAFRNTLEVLGDEFTGPTAQQRDRRREGPSPREEWERDRKAALYNLGLLYANSGEFDKSAEMYQEYLEMEPGHTDALQNLASVYLSQDKFEEAADVYSELVQQPDLAPIQYYAAGIGLYRVRRMVEAAEAFHKAIEANPFFRDALFNYMQALHSRAAELEEIREDLTGEDAEKAREELMGLYDRLIENAKRLQEMDPYNRIGLALEGRAYRSITDLKEDDDVREAWYMKFLEVAERVDAMRFEIPDVRMVYLEEHVQITGQLDNRSLEEGEEVTLRFSFFGEDHEVAGTEDVTIAAPAAEQSVSFEFMVENKGFIGWKYEEVN